MHGWLPAVLNLLGLAGWLPAGRTLRVAAADTTALRVTAADATTFRVTASTDGSL